MGKIIYTVLASADGYFEDADGKFDWAQPDETIHTFINNSEKMTSTLLFGRKMYDVMKVWEDFPGIRDMPDYIIEYASIWRKSKKIVYSKSLLKPETSRTVVRRSIDKDEIERMKELEDGNIGVGGADLASQLLSLRLVDEIHLYSFPVLVGAGKKWISTSEEVKLSKSGCREFENGVVLTTYNVVQV